MAHRFPATFRGPALGLLLVGAAAFAVFGCHEEEPIRSYQVPKPEMNRLLGGILPHGDSTWFFKLSGPSAAVGEHEKEFDQFLHSVRFADGGEKPITWTLPAGWKQESDAGGGVVYATLVVGPKDAGLRLTVTRLGREGQAASVLANVNRWRNQLALPAVTQEELDRTTKSQDLNGVRAVLVDLTGTGSGRTGMGGPPMGGGRRAAPAARKKSAELTYQTPAGWEKAKGNGISQATFQITAGDQTATVTVTPLPGGAGGLEQNVNRWRGQVGLKPQSDEEVKKSVTPIPVSGMDGQYVDLEGATQRILAVLAARDDTTWFIKMSGPVQLVGREKANFEAFVRSIRFDGGPGGNDE
jgi:hypothetical protein